MELFQGIWNQHELCVFWYPYWILLTLKPNADKTAIKNNEFHKYVLEFNCQPLTPWEAQFGQKKSKSLYPTVECVSIRYMGAVWGTQHCSKMPVTPSACNFAKCLPYLGYYSTWYIFFAYGCIKLLRLLGKINWKPACKLRRYEYCIIYSMYIKLQRFLNLRYWSSGGET
jgi:hypothetical protein